MFDFPVHGGGFPFGGGCKKMGFPWGQFSNKFSLEPLLHPLFSVRPVEGSDWLLVAHQVHENEDEIVVRLQVPGFEREDIQVFLTDDRELVVQGLGRNTSTDTGKTGAFQKAKGQQEEDLSAQEKPEGDRERKEIRFRRVFELPDNVDPDLVSGEVKNGILVVKLRKIRKATTSRKVMID